MGLGPQISRRDFIGRLGGSAASAALAAAAACSGKSNRISRPPNLVLVMADDLGWGDTGYNGHPLIQTPILDEMAASGVQFNRFYSAAPVCSPTRGSCLTGRHPYRYGVFSANIGHMPPEEINLAEALKTQGYTTGHFGKWHLGTMTKTIVESNRGGRPEHVQHYSPPWLNGFDECFSTEAKVPTWDPMKHPETGETYGTWYWKKDGTRETENLEGDDSRVIMDRVIPFVRNAASRGKPFLAVVWFHTPHLPIVAGPEYRKLYAELEEPLQNYYGCITAMDQQLGRLRKELRALGVAENTLVTFCSDNGPEGTSGMPFPHGGYGSAGPFRGRKRDLWEGGVRVPGLLEWPGKIKQPLTLDMPCCTSDYYPTVLDILGLEIKGQPQPLDGISLLPAIEGRMRERPEPIAFEFRDRMALIGNRYKLIRPGKIEAWMLFDILEDPGETTDLAAEKPEIVRKMKEVLLAWQESCNGSREGKDYR